MEQEYLEQRTVPRYPLPKERLKITYHDGEKVFALRDLSLRGLGISLLEVGEALLFPVGFQCSCELHIGAEILMLPLRVARMSAWSIGFTFVGLTRAQEDKIRNFIDPMRIGATLRKIDDRVAPEAFLQGLNAWYHGDSATDLFIWNDPRGGIQRALMSVGSKFWEWNRDTQIRTGAIEYIDDNRVLMRGDPNPDILLQHFVHKVFDHAEAVDFRLLSFLKEKTK